MTYILLSAEPNTPGKSWFPALLRDFVFYFSKNA